MNEFDMNSVCGLPIEAACERLRKNNISYTVVEYASPRGPLGEDRRVLRAVMRGETAELICAGFCTTVNGDNIG